MFPFQLQSTCTADLDAETRGRIRALLDEAFEGDFSDLDWGHALGGRHVLAFAEGRLVGHVALVARRLLHQGRTLRAGYVEALGVAPRWRRRAIGTALMRQLEAELRRGYELGALSASEAGPRFYQALGWTWWQGRTSVLTDGRLVPSPEDDGSVWVLPLAVSLSFQAELTCDWRAGDSW